MQFLTAWEMHCSKNRLLLDQTPDSGMDVTMSTRGGRTIAQQWIHIHNVRLQWLEVCAPDLYKKYKKLDGKTPVSKDMIVKSLDSSASGIRDLMERGWDNGGKVKGFRNGIIPLLGYFISHESHHRGNMLLTLKCSGVRIPDTVKWGLWEWSK